MYPLHNNIVAVGLSFPNSQRIVRSQPSVPGAKRNLLLATVGFRTLVVSRILWVALLYLAILITD